MAAGAKRLSCHWSEWWRGGDGEGGVGGRGSWGDALGGGWGSAATARNLRSYCIGSL